MGYYGGKTLIVECFCDKVSGSCAATYDKVVSYRDCVP